MSMQFSLDKADGVHVAKVFGYSVASSAIGALVLLIADVHASGAVMLVIPAVNTLLVTVQKWLEDRPMAN